MEKLIITARIDEQTHRDLRSVAEREDRSVSWLVRKAVEGYLAGQGVSKVEKKNYREGG